MLRISTSSAAYLAAATLMGAVALPVSMDLAATQVSGSGMQMVQAGTSTAAPIAPLRSSHTKPASLQKGQQPVNQAEARIKKLHPQLKIKP